MLVTMSRMKLQILHMREQFFGFLLVIHQNVEFIIDPPRNTVVVETSQGEYFIIGDIDFLVQVFRMEFIDSHPLFAEFFRNQ